MEALLARYGYLLLFPGVLIEGEAFLLAAAFMAQRGTLDLTLVIAVASAATMLGDQVYYRAARSRGRKWLERRQGQRARYERWIDRASRHGVLLLLASRWTFGLRMVIPAACGVSGMRPAVFTVVDTIGVVVWATAVGLLGYYGGEAVEARYAQFKSAAGPAGVAIMVGVAAVIAVRRLRKQGRLRELDVNDLHAVAPFAMALIGAFYVISSGWPRPPAGLARIAHWAPLGIADGDRLMMLFTGIALLQVTRNIAARKEAAWWVAVGALVMSLIHQIAADFDVHRLAVALPLLAYLVVFRRRFVGRSDPATLRVAVLTAPWVVLVVVAYGYFGFLALQSRFEWPPGTGPAWEAVRGGVLGATPAATPRDAQASAFSTSVTTAAWLTRFYVLFLLLRPFVLRRRLEAPPDEVRRIRSSNAHDGFRALALNRDKHHLVLPSGRGHVGFAVRDGVAVACGAPLCAPGDVAECAREFVEYCRRHGWIACFYGLSSSDAAALAQVAPGPVPIGAEAIVELNAFTPQPALYASTVHAYAAAAGADPVTEEQIAEVSDDWLTLHGVAELHFTLGPLDFQDLDERAVYVLTDELSTVQAFCTWTPYANGRGMALDVLRRRPSAPQAIVSMLLMESLRMLRAAGVEEASLGIVPVDVDASDPRAAEVAGKLAPLNAYRDVGALRQLASRLEPRLLAVSPGAGLTRALAAVVAAHTSLHDKTLGNRLTAWREAIRSR